MHKNTVILILLAFLTSVCSDPVREFKGFTVKEMENLLSGYSSEDKDWLLTERTINDSPVEIEGCLSENRMVFDVGSGVNLLSLKYNPQICDSLDFCTMNPVYCINDTAICNANASLCRENTEEYNYLNIGLWEVMEPEIDNGTTDSLIFMIYRDDIEVFVEKIDSENLILQYDLPTTSDPVKIREVYQYLRETATE